MDCIFNQIQKYKTAKDKVDFKSLWRFGTKREKFSKCIENLFERNFVEYMKYDPLNDLEMTTFENDLEQGNKQLLQFLREFIRDNNSDASDEEHPEFKDLEYISLASKEEA